MRNFLICKVLEEQIMLNVLINDEKLCETAQQLGHHTNPQETIEKALKMYVEYLQQQGVIQTSENENLQLTEGQKALAILQGSGFIGCLQGDGNLSQDYKQVLDWQDKV